MNVLPHLDIFEECFTNGNSVKNKVYFDILYNSSNKICVSKNYIDLIEKQVENKEAFKALITELSDSDRICIEESQNKDCIIDEFVEIARMCNKEILVPVVKNHDLMLTNKLRLVLTTSNITPNSREWIVFELITKGVCNVSFINFKSNKDITAFFDNVYEIPSKVRCIYIFDRDITSTNRAGLKNRPIQYYTLLSGGWKNKHLIKPDFATLKKELGSKVKLFYTSKRKLLHERKIFIDDLIISSDNSMINLLVDEPTWEISIVYNGAKVREWTQKCCNFELLN